jgi:stress-induced morphogen
MEWPNFEDTKGIIRNRQSKKDRQYNDQRFADIKRGNIRSRKCNERRRTNRHTMINKILHRKLKYEQHELHRKTGVKSWVLMVNSS